MSDCDSSGGNFVKSYGNKFIPYDTSLSKLLKDRFLCDVIIRVKKTNVPVHRVILSASSCFFHDLFKNVDTIKQVFNLTYIFIEPDNLDKILIYIYKGYVNIGNSNILSLLTMNKVLRISSLTNHCAQFLLSKLRPMNAFETWQIAWKYSLQELANISQIVCRECVSDVLLRKNNVIIFCEEFLSHVLATDVMAPLSPRFVVRILEWWTSHQQFENDEKSDKFLSLMNIYLNWKTLSKTEMEVLIGNIHSCFELDPLLSNSRLESWSRNISQLAAIDRINEKESDNCLKNQQTSDWSLIITEYKALTVGIYCNVKSRWFSMQAVDNPKKVIGFLRNFLVLRPTSNSLFLRNVGTMISQTLASSRFTDDDSVKCIDTKDSTVFMHLDNIYCIDTVMHTTGNYIICIINRWDQQRNGWITVLRLNTKLSNNTLPVSLTVETSGGDYVYLFMTLKMSCSLQEIPSESTAFKGRFGTRFGEEVSQRQLKMLYVYSINMKDFSYRQIGKRRNKPTDLNDCRKIILQDKIIFLLNPDRYLERKFGHAYHNRTDCYLSCLQLALDGENCWMSLQLRAPFPDVRDISIRKRDIIRLDCSVTTCKNLLFVGIHWSPHFYQVFKYDISTLIVSSLPTIPLPAINRISINAFLVYQPISDFICKQIRFSDFLNCHFEDWSLLSWDGTSN